MVLKPSYRYQAEVERVVNGDTIDAVIDLGFRIKTTQRLRLAGLNAPEVRGAERARGLQTKQYVQRRIQDNNNQILVETERTSKWGRWIATVYLPDCPKSLNEELIEKGLALRTRAKDPFVEVISAPIECPYYWGITDFHKKLADYACELLVNSYNIHPSEMHREYCVQTDWQRHWSKLGPSYRSWYLVDVVGTRDGKPYIAVECGGCSTIKLRDLKTIFAKVIHIVGGTYTPAGDDYRAAVRKEHTRLMQERMKRREERQQRYLDLRSRGQLP